MLPVTTVLVLTPIFLVIFACTMFALEHTGLREAKLVLALAVSALCMLGLMRGGTGKESMVDVILIPYEALTYSLIFIVVLWLLSRTSRWGLKVRTNWLRQAEEERRARRHYARTNEEGRRSQESPGKARNAKKPTSRR